MSPEIPRDAAGRVIRPRPSQLLMDVMDKLGPDHLTTRTLMAALIERDRGAGVEPRAVTPGYGWHLPVLADPPNVPYDMQELALDIEGTDTGWRDDSAALTFGWTGSMKLRRVGAVVELHARELVVPATWNVNVYTIPSGFRPNGTRYYRATNQTATYAALPLQIMNTGAITIQGGTQTAGNKVYIAAMWLTTNAWPTALPGIPSGLLRDELEELPDAEGKPA